MSGFAERVERLEESMREGQRWRALSHDKRRCFEGDCLTVLHEFIAEVFTTQAVRESLFRLADPSVNVMRRVPERVAMLYARGAWRTVGGETGRYEALMREAAAGGLDGFMGDVQRRVIALGKVAVQPVFVRGRLSLVVHDPENVFVLQDGCGGVEAVAFRIGGGAGHGGRIMYWDGERQAVLDNALNDVTSSHGEWLAEPSGENPYGVVPFAFFEAERCYGDFFGACHASDGLHLGGLHLMLFATELNHQIKWGSFRQLHVAGQVRAEDLTRALRDSMAIFVTEEGSSVQVLPTTADIEGMRAAIAGKLEDIATGYGLSLADFRRTSQVTSGFARALEREGIADYNRRMASLFAEGEAQLCDVARAVVTHHRGDAAGVGDGPFEIAYAEMGIVESESDRFALFERKVGAGLARYSEWWGSVSDDEALSRAAAIAAFNTSWRAMQRQQSATREGGMGDGE